MARLLWEMVPPSPRLGEGKTEEVAPDWLRFDVMLLLQRKDSLCLVFIAQILLKTTNGKHENYVASTLLTQRWKANKSCLKFAGQLTLELHKHKIQRGCPLAETKIATGGAPGLSKFI